MTAMGARATEIRAGVAALVAAADPDAVVHDYRRFAADWGVFLNRYKVTVSGSEVIRGWEVTFTKMDDMDLGGRRFRNVYGVQVLGYFGVYDSDASEKTAFNAAEAMIVYLRQYPTLNGVLTWGGYVDKSDMSTWGSWPSIDVFEPRFFGDTLCHYVEINFEVFENETVTYSE